MFQRKTRRFGRRTNDRNNMSRNNLQIRSRSNLFSNEQTRNTFRSPLSAEKLFEKYSTLAKEAMCSGDRILSENYLQHADHFLRIIQDKNRIRNQNKVNFIDKPAENNQNYLNNNNINQSEENKNND